MSAIHNSRLYSRLANGFFYALAFSAASFGGSLVGTSEAKAQSANSNVSTTSEIKVERVETDANGQQKTVLSDPNSAPVVPGDRVVIVNSYQNTGSQAASNFVTTNPIHPALAFVSVDEDWAEVSVDDGKTWGKLNELTVAADRSDEDAAATTTVTRSAAPADVTHIRWTFPKPIAPGEKGKLTFRAVVR
ncbi:hypothetical protein [Alterisphingorhabdus coralli]|uniref:DUF11 domain-containing protein n=1 Tax=Alterisphingorhabdus coralli TaxID=3071408 RepID=A0AA97FBV3_9SPHN|nr:hypothetical protein [Parasphingorhabdus sp. SCSIO 66989]WOE76195.1 hypothetical protein RB602_05645 [Parasphingorhabdus sp. SCSIO 66989]